MAVLPPLPPPEELLKMKAKRAAILPPLPPPEQMRSRSSGFDPRNEIKAGDDPKTIRAKALRSGRTTVGVAPEESLGDKAWEHVGNVGRGVYTGVGSLVGFAGNALSELDDFLTGSVSPGGIRATMQGGIYGKDRNAVERAGESVKETGQRGFGPRQPDPSVLAQAEESLGIMAPMAAAIPLTGPTALVVGAGIPAAQGYNLATEEGRAAGWTSAETKSYARIMGVLGTTEAMPFARLWGRMTGPVKKQVAATLAKRVALRIANAGKFVGTQAAKETGQEVGSGFLGEIARLKTDNPEMSMPDAAVEASRKMFEGDEAKVAALLGAAFGTFGLAGAPRVEFLAEPVKTWMANNREMATKVADRIRAKEALRRQDVKNIPGYDKSSQDDRDALAASMEAHEQALSNEARGEGYAIQRPQPMADRLGMVEPEAALSSEGVDFNDGTWEQNPDGTMTKVQPLEVGPREAPANAPTAPVAPETQAASPSVPEQAPEAVAGAKEPWQMTREEFQGETLLSGVPHPSLQSRYATDFPNMAAEFAEQMQAIGAPEPGTSGKGVVRVYRRTGSKYRTQNEYSLPDNASPLAEMTPQEARDNPHKALVSRAIREGKPVPPEVLAEYPDLGAAPAQAPIQGPPSPEAPGVSPEDSMAPYSLQYADRDRVGEAIGIDPREPTAPQKQEAALEAAGDLVARDSNLPDRIISRAKAGEPLSTVDSAVLLRELTSSLNYRESVWSESPSKARDAELKRIDRRIEDIYDATDAAGSETGRALNFRKLFVDQSMEPVHMIREAEGLAKRPLSKEEKAKIEQRAAEEKATKKAEDEAVAANEARKAAKAETDLFAETVAAVEKEEGIGKPEDPKIMAAFKRWVAMVNKRADHDAPLLAEAMERLRKGETLSAVGLDPKILKYATNVLAAKMVNFSVDVATLTAEMVKQFGKEISPYLDEAIARAKVLVGEDLKKATPLASKATREKVKAAVKPAPKAKEDVQAKALRKIESKFKDGDVYAISPQVQALAKEFIRGGTRDLEVLMNQLMDAIEPIIPGITREQVGMAFSGYGNYQRLSTEEVDVVSRDLKREEMLLLQIADLEKQLAPKPSGQERTPTTKKHRALLKKIARLKKQLPPDLQTTRNTGDRLRTAVEATEARLRHTIEDMTEEIINLKQAVKDKGPKVTSPEIEALQEVVDELRKLYDQIFPKGPRPQLTDAQRVETALKAVRKAIEARKKNIQLLEGGQTPLKKTLFKKKPVQSPELDAARAENEALKATEEELMAQLNPALENVRDNLAFRRRAAQDMAKKTRQIAEKDFAPKKRKEVALDEESLKAKVAHEKVIEDWRKAKKQFEWEGKSKLEKAYAIAASSANASRVILTNFLLDFSAFGRQGWFVLHSRPTVAVKAAKEMFKAWSSKEGQLAVAEEIKSRKNYQDGTYFKAKLIKPLEGGVEGSGGREEMTNSDWIHKVWGIRASARAYDTFMLVLRCNVFDMAQAQMARHTSNIPDSELQSIAYYINTVTGRYPGKRLQSAGPFLNTWLLAPKFVASNWSTGAGVPLWRAMRNGDKMAAKIIAQDYVKSAATIMSLIGLASMFGVDFERRLTHRNFGSFRIGDDWISPFGGIPSVYTFIGRLYYGGRVDPKTGGWKPSRAKAGEKLPFGRQTSWDDVQDYLAGKLHPWPRGAFEKMFGDQFGNYVSWGEAMKNMYMPITAQEIVDTWAAEGFDPARFAKLFGTQGAGFGSKPNVYPKK